MEPEHLKKVAEYVAMQCYGCSDSPMILAFKAYDVMKKAVEEKENPYKALNKFLGTNVPEDVLEKYKKIRNVQYPFIRCRKTNDQLD